MKPKMQKRKFSYFLLIFLFALHFAAMTFHKSLFVVSVYLDFHSPNTQKFCRVSWNHPCFELPCFLRWFSRYQRRHRRHIRCHETNMKWPNLLHTFDPWEHKHTHAQKSSAHIRQSSVYVSLEKTVKISLTFCLPIRYLMCRYLPVFNAHEKSIVCQKRLHIRLGQRKVNDASFNWKSPCRNVFFMCRKWFFDDVQIPKKLIVCRKRDRKSFRSALKSQNDFSAFV